MQLHLHTLGKLRITYNSEDLTGKLSLKAQAMLCYLVVTGEAQSRHALAGLLWGDVPEAKAKNSLRVTLAALRKRLPNCLIVTHQTIAFDKTVGYWLDCVVLGGMVREGNPAGTNLTTLYRGEFLSDFFVEGAMAFDEWLITQRAYWQQQARLAFTQVSDHLLANRAYHEAIIVLQHWLALSPWQESAHRQLMTAYSRTRDFASALVQYETCRQNLLDELGVEPSPETAQLAEQIQIARSAHHLPLPTDDTPFVGREDEVQQVVDMLLQPAHRLVTIAGVGGMGKTRLAVAVARRIRAEQTLAFLHGVVFVGLQPVSGVTALPLVLADKLEVVLSGRVDPIKQLSDHLRQREMLLVLDNFEHLLDASTILQQLLSQCPRLKLLVTSREPLQIRTESRFDLAGLPVPERSGMGKVDDSSAVRLFVQTAQQVQTDFQLTEANQPQVAQLCRLVAGMPLAIELAARWLRTLPLDEIVVEVTHNLDLLATRMRGVPSRQQSMAAVFDYTWALLSPAGRQTFAQLSQFRGGFSAQASRHIANLSPHRLAELTDHGLLHLSGEGRYTIHELARQYGATKLSAEQTQAIRSAHSRYYAQTAHDLTPDLYNAKQKQAFASLHNDIGNCQQAWETATTALDKPSLGQLVDPLYLFFEKQAWFSEGIALFGQTINTLVATGQRDTDTLRLLSQIYARQGALQGLIGRYEPAYETLEKGVQLAQMVEEPYVISFAWRTMATLLREQSRAKEAQQYVESALTIAQELDDPILLAPTIERQASITWDLGRHGPAIDQMQESLTIFRKLGDPSGTGRALNGLGNVAMSMGRGEQAITYFEEALTIYKDLEAWLPLDTALINLGMTSQDLGRTAQARDYYEQSLAICRRIGDEVGIAYCYTGLGLAARSDGDTITARKMISQSWQMNRSLGRDRYVGINVNFLGDLDKQAGNFASALERYNEAMGIFERISHPWGVAVTHNRLGELRLAQDDPAGAIPHFSQASQISDHNEMHGTFIHGMLQLVEALKQLGKLEIAVMVLGYVGVCPAGDDDDRTTAQNLLERYASQLPEETASQAKAQGEKASLETLLQSVS